FKFNQIVHATSCRKRQRRTAAITALLGWSLLAFSARVRADALDNWRASQIVTNGGYDLADPGFIQSSEDGINWTNRYSSGPIWDLADVVFAQGTFVAVGWDYYGAQNLYSSTDGISWTGHTNATVSNFYSVTCGLGTFGAPLFVAVGDGSIPGDFNN